MDVDGLYLRHLAGVAGIQSYQLDGDSLRIETAAGPATFAVKIYRSNLRQDTADHIVAQLAQVAQRGSTEHALVLAPNIGGQIAKQLQAAKINFIDGNGNLFIAHPNVLINIAGRRARPRRTAADLGLRGPGYQVLFVLAAEPTLISATTRQLATLAGVAPQTVSHMKARLVQEKYVRKTADGYRWFPNRRDDVIAWWLRGYLDVVRPSLYLGTYRTRDANPNKLEERLGEALEREGSEYRWGGSTALYRMNGHYRGMRTTVHLRKMPTDFRKQILGGVNDEKGNLVVLQAFGQLNWRREDQLVDPLLAYSEAAYSRDDRAMEAASRVLETEIAPKWTD